MADEETTADEALFYEDGTALTWARYQPYTSNLTKDEIAYLEFKDRIEAKLAKGEPVYCQIMDDRRAGSVGRISSITFHYQPSQAPNARQHSWYSNRGIGAQLHINDIEIVWDGRKNKVKPLQNEVEILEHWDPAAGTIWKWTQGVKEKVEPIPAYDHLDNEIKPGMNVCFVHRRYGQISMMFGTVSRITDKGSVFIKRLKLRDNDVVDEYKALDMDDVIIVDNNLMSRLVMARLAAQ